VANDDFKLDFVGVGFPKCGTSWVADVISQHPNVDFASNKEPGYFHDIEYIQRYHSDEVSTWQRNRPKNKKQYRKLFLNNNKKRGEFTTNYVYNINALKRIKEQNDSIKVIVCTRDFVKASFSKYLYDLKFKPDVKASKEKYFDLINNDSIFCNYFNFNKHLEKVRKVFNRHNILIIDMEDIQSKPEIVWQTLISFIELPDYDFDKLESSKKNTQAQLINFPGVKLILKLSEILQNLPIDERLVAKFIKPGRILYKKTDLKLTSSEYQKARAILESNFTTTNNLNGPRSHNHMQANKLNVLETA
jgi:Sulfotransferase domain